MLLPREAPLNLAHIRNMEAVTLMGGVIFPPVPALYQRPAVDRRDGRPHASRACSTCSTSTSDKAPRWGGRSARRATSAAIRRRERPRAGWCRQRDSNPRPSVYKTAALPAELCRHVLSCGAADYLIRVSLGRSPRGAGRRVVRRAVAGLFAVRRLGMRFADARRVPSVCTSDISGRPPAPFRPWADPGRRRAPRASNAMPWPFSRA